MLATVEELCQRYFSARQVRIEYAQEVAVGVVGVYLLLTVGRVGDDLARGVQQRPRRAVSVVQEEQRAAGLRHGRVKLCLADHVEAQRVSQSAGD